MFKEQFNSINIYCWLTMHLMLGPENKHFDLRGLYVSKSIPQSVFGAKIEHYRQGRAEGD